MDGDKHGGQHADWRYKQARLLVFFCDAIYNASRRCQHAAQRSTKDLPPRMNVL